ncbi:MAG: hypothetical protein JOZ41_21900 [Chloroflexi bacterium]|nr:hypothetical protein [Chloroflexota bacterium]
MRSKIQEIERLLLTEGVKDYVGLWSVFWVVRLFISEADPALVRCIVLTVLFDLIDAGLIVAGFPTRDGRGFEPWDWGPTETIRAVQEGLHRLGREPTLGEIVWFTSTPTGNDIVAEYASSEEVD